ncbi:unnamed protein product, partial [Iphiclides podalirius]
MCRASICGNSVRFDLACFSLNVVTRFQPPMEDLPKPGSLTKPGLFVQQTRALFAVQFYLKILQSLKEINKSSYFHLPSGGKNGRADRTTWRTSGGGVNKATCTEQRAETNWDGRSIKAVRVHRPAGPFPPRDSPR